MKNTVSWFEIPVDNFNRAVKFYNEVFEIKLVIEDFGESQMGMWPQENVHNSGTLVKHRKYKPSKDGVRLFLNAGENLNIPLSKVEDAGGKIITQKTLIDEENGCFAWFQDTEGNVIGLHSIK